MSHKRGGGGVAYLTLTDTAVISDMRVFGTPFDDLYAALNAHKPFVCNAETGQDVSVPCRYNYGNTEPVGEWITITIDNGVIDTPALTLFSDGNGFIVETPVTYTYNTTTCEYEFT